MTDDAFTGEAASRWSARRNTPPRLASRPRGDGVPQTRAVWYGRRD